MKEIIVLEDWFSDTLPSKIGVFASQMSASWWHMRLVTDGEDIWIEYKFFTTEFWRRDEGMETCSDETFNDLVPVFGLREENTSYA